MNKTFDDIITLDDLSPKEKDDNTNDDRKTG